MSEVSSEEWNFKEHKLFADMNTNIVSNKFIEKVRLKHKKKWRKVWKLLKSAGIDMYQSDSEEEN